MGPIILVGLLTCGTLLRIPNVETTLALKASSQNDKA